MEGSEVGGAHIVYCEKDWDGGSMKSWALNCFYVKVII